MQQTNEFNLYHIECPSHNIFAHIGNKWSILILLKLAEKSFQFGELQRSLDNISAKVLTDNLNKLHKINLIERIEHFNNVITVEYKLAELGKSLIPHLESITQWTVRNMESLLKEQETNV